jgi:hypothetical protein
MRVSAGGFYEIEGAALRVVTEVSPGKGAADCWRDRQADLCAESSTLVHVNHPLSDDEVGLWRAMQAELSRIGRILGGLERGVGRLSSGAHR